MSKTYKNLNKTTFKNGYNIIKVSNTLTEIMKQLKSFNPDTDAVAFGKRKELNDSKPPKWFADFVNNEFKPFKQMVISQFKNHGWIK